MNAADGQPEHIDADVSAEKIARVYAEALLTEAGKANLAQEVLEDLDFLVHQVFQANQEIEEFLTGGGLRRESRAALIEKAFAGQTNQLFLNFLFVLNEHDRLHLIRGVLRLYRQLLERQQGLVRVFVRSAAALPQDQLDRLHRELQGLLHGEPVLQTGVDPALLGGLVVRVGDWVYDASVRSQLDRLQDQIIERGSHEIQGG